MIYSINIKNNEKAPLKYLDQIPAFKNGSKYTFKPGVNAIIGENGSGKSTMLKLIQLYMSMDYFCYKSRNFNELINNFNNTFYDGAIIKADYTKNTFRMSHAEEFRLNSDIGMGSFDNFGTMFNTMHSSTGEGVVNMLNLLLKKVFSDKVQLEIPYLADIEEEFKWYNEHKTIESAKLYQKLKAYIEKNNYTKVNAYTLLLDEPDRNLSLTNLNNIKVIFDEPRDDIQVIAVIHNPLLICSLAHLKHINWIELTPGYKDYIITEVSNFIKP